MSPRRADDAAFETTDRVEVGLDSTTTLPPPLMSASRAVPPSGGVLASTSHDHHLRRDHLHRGLGARTVSGGFVTALVQAFQVGLNVLTVAMLARLLSPQDFGLVAMASAVIAFLAIFRDAGLFTATVQQGELTHQQVSNLFWVNLALGAFAGLASACSAPFVAQFYRDERLVSIMLALSVTFVLAGCTVQHEALLIRQMRFRTRALIQLASLVFGFATACLLAFTGYGYWSLVWMQLSSAGVLLVLAWSLSRWRPSLPGRGRGTASLLRFGVHLTIGSTIASFCTGSDTFLIGRLYGAEAVGFYSRGTVLLLRPLQQLLSPIGAVLLPGLSLLQDDAERYRRVFARVLDIVTIVCFPLTGVLCSLAQPFVLVLLGHQWLSTAPVFFAFSFAGVYLPLGYAAGWLMESQGRGRDVLKSNAYLGVLILLAVLIGSLWGPIGVALAVSLSGLSVRIPVLFYVAGRKGPVRTAHLWAGLLRHFPSWVVAFGAAAGARQLSIELSSVWQLVLCAPTGLVAGVAVALASKSSRSSARHFLDLVRSASHPS